MKRILTLFLIALFFAPASAGQSVPVSWTVSARDVYIDGEIDRQTIFLVSDYPRLYAILSPRLDAALVLERDARTVRTAARDAFRFAADGSTANSPALSGEPAGRFSLIENSTYLITHGGKTVLIRPHVGLAGDASEQQVFDVAPAWRKVMEAHKPNANIVAALREVAEDTQIVVALGTWCPDSKRYIPGLLKAIHEAANPRLKVRFVGVNNSFLEPLETIQRLRIVNVPTVIVERGGRELGRIIETPASSTMEEDLSAILRGTPKKHTGSFERGPAIAYGVYTYRDASGEARGSERWELFRTREGGFLLFSEITDGEAVTQIFYRVDAARRPSFVEVSRRRGDHFWRARYSISGARMTVRWRGDQSGVTTQNLSVPARFAIASASAAAEGLNWQGARGQKQIAVYESPDESALGELGVAGYEAQGAERVRVAAGEFDTMKIVRQTGGRSVELWLHNRLNLPVKGKLAGGASFEMTAFELLNGGR